MRLFCERRCLLFDLTGKKWASLQVGGEGQDRGFYFQKLFFLPTCFLFVFHLYMLYLSAVFTSVTAFELSGCNAFYDLSVFCFVWGESISVCTAYRWKLFYCLQSRFISCSWIFISVPCILILLWSYCQSDDDTSGVSLLPRSWLCCLFLVFVFSTDTSNSRTRVKTISDRAPSRSHSSPAEGNVVFSLQFSVGRMSHFSSWSC